MTNSTSNTLTTGQQLRDGVPTFSEQVRGTGFVVLRKPELAGLISEADLAELRGAWENLPVDTQVHGVGVYRERRYGRLRADVDGDTVTLQVLPNAVFRQDAIPLWEGKDRVFEPIAEDVLLSPGLRALVGFDARMATAVNGNTSWKVGVHLVRVVARAGSDGLPTPEGRHRDGHTCVGLHLMRRDGVTGGLSTVHPNDGSDIVQTTLLQPLDSMFFDDNMITHEVSPTIAEGTSGVRDMLQIDFNPMD
ncbi:2OG-Fe dioxygenase family protein [Streptomyces sp. MCA2]|uniref:2OG-Fe dioxygenase family protein n=1 Tax=Streptomyces sp. MCA2 TaxID=2944805 RepID=UPI00201FD2BD|nr:2OG-Fe dioxygenase family protein [Streptomyces sp. MCA2]MCL7494564.1 2OG-Fe dioxygenase family protein [Streptomyces sp. MCA2]